MMHRYTPRHLHRSPTRQRPWSRQITAGFVAAGLVLLAPTPAHAQPVREAQAPSIVVAIKGNTLSGLAARWCGNGNAYHGLAAGNGIANPNLIYIGQRIKVTCTAVRPPTTTASRSNPTRTTPPVASGAWTNPLPGVRLSSCWGAGRNHKGLDFDGVMGQPVRAAAAGTVSNVGWIGSGYGLEVMISHGGGIWSHYAHLSRAAVVKGQHVNVGQTIATVGNSGDVVRGASDGSHLHFEVSRSAGIFGSQIDPAPWLRSHGVALGGC